MVPITGWFDETVIATGRMPLFVFFVSVIIGFAIARTTTRLIRAQVRWWPRNVVVGDVHVHHAVFGVVLMLIGGVTGLAVPVESVGWRSVAAALFGLGAAAVLDEFALILRLQDVYWTAEGRVSVDAVFAALAVTGLILLGIEPIGLDDFLEAASQGTADGWVLAIVLTTASLTLAIVTVLKGKVATGLFGLFFPLLLIVGAVRLARPASPWARRRYHRPGERFEHKLARATRRERRLRGPVSRLTTRMSDLIAGRPDPPAGPATSKTTPPGR